MPVTIKQVLEFKLKTQHARTLSCAQDVLDDVQRLMRRLELADIPTTALNCNSLSQLEQAHSKLRQINEDLEDLQKCE